MNTRPGSLLAVLVTLVTFLTTLCGCDPAALTRLRVAPRPPVGGEGAASAVAVTDTDVQVVVSIVAEVAERHGLERLEASEPGLLAEFFRRWEQVGDGHARTLRVTVSQSPEHPELIEVTVSEWLSWGHSDLGQHVLDELRSRLLERCTLVQSGLAHPDAGVRPGSDRQCGLKEQST